MVPQGSATISTEAQDLRHFHGAAAALQPHQGRYQQISTEEEGHQQQTEAPQPVLRLSWLNDDHGAYGSIWAANHICYVTQLTGCSYPFYKLNMMFLTKRGTSEYYFPYTQIRAVAHMAYVSWFARPTISSFITFSETSPEPMQPLANHLVHDLVMDSRKNTHLVRPTYFTINSGDLPLPH